MPRNRAAGCYTDAMAGAANDLPMLVLASCDRVRVVISSLTRHHDDLQRLAARLDEVGGLEPEAVKARSLASALDLAFTELARQRLLLAKAAGGGPRDLRPATGEYRLPEPEDTKRLGARPRSGGRTSE